MVNDGNILQNVILKCKLTANSKSSAFNVENITQKYVRCYIDDKYKGLINIDNCTLMYHFTTGMGSKGDNGCTPDNQPSHRICMIMLGPKDYKERFSKGE